MIYNEDIYIIPLTKEYLKQSIRLLNSVFNDEDEPIKKEIEASIDKRKFIIYKKRYDADIQSLEYFIAVNRSVLGIIGLYSTKQDFYDTYWIGWYCVNKIKRGKGIGKALINYVIDESRSRGKKYLKLYTSTDKNEEDAQKIYEKNNFYITDIVDKDDYKIIYREKIL